MKVTTRIVDELYPTLPSLSYLLYPIIPSLPYPHSVSTIRSQYLFLILIYVSLNAIIRLPVVVEIFPLIGCLCRIYVVVCHLVQSHRIGYGWFGASVALFGTLYLSCTLHVIRHVSKSTYRIYHIISTSLYDKH